MAGDGTDGGQKTSAEMESQNLTGLISGGTADRIADPSAPGPARMVAGGGHPSNKFTRYTGPNLTNVNNQFEYINGVPQGLYDETIDAKRILNGMQGLDRKNFLNDVAIALGKKYKPSKLGLTETDINAVGYVLRQANDMRRTVDVALAYMIEQGGGFLDTEGGGGGRTYTVTSADDIKPLANELALKLYGRAVDPQALNRIVRAVQQEEIGYQSRSSSGGVVERSTSAQNVITQELMKADPEAAMVEGTASVVDMVRRALGT